MFLVACTRLYKSLCRSVGQLVCLSVGLSVGLSRFTFGPQTRERKHRRGRGSAIGNQWEKDEEEDMKKGENKRHQKKDSVHRKTVSPY